MTFITNILTRFAGKKFVTVAVGCASIVYVWQQAWTEVEEPALRTWISIAACVSVAITVAGFAIGQGIGDAGERRPKSEP